MLDLILAIYATILTVIAVVVFFRNVGYEGALDAAGMAAFVLALGAIFWFVLWFLFHAWATVLP